ncbi:MAG: hypothetical protein O2855_08930 [Planctomycetota bacterium]|nr:hypothetical protein [Planctomycetota bacterium]
MEHFTPPILAVVIHITLCGAIVLLVGLAVIVDIFSDSDKGK